VSGSPVDVAGVVYASISQAARAHGISQHGMEWRIDSDSFPDHKRLPAIRRPAGDHLVGRALIEPERWPFDGDLSRRAPVLDPNINPPRVVRRVGWLRCMRCSRPTFSEDVVGIRICFECGGSGSVPIGRISDLEDEAL
jgi:hypothetical protein